MHFLTIFSGGFRRFYEITRKKIPAIHRDVFEECDFIISRYANDNNTNVAKTPIFQRFYENARLQYIQYNCVRLFQKSSEISAFSVVNKFSVVFLG